jgi:protein-L-isoaspartate O-methyltransferase
MVIPVGDKRIQTLTVVRREADDRITTSTVGDARFVPLLGQFGFRET